MMTETDLALGAAGLKDLQPHYETLRQNYFDGVGGWAMSVFVREGMCGWIRAWMGHAQDAGSKRASKRDPNINDETGKDHGELVGLIAAMTLAKLKGEQGVWMKKRTRK